MMRWRLLYLIALVATVGGALDAAADTQERSYVIFRDGSEIGTRELRISRNGDEVVVDIETDIKIKVAFITVFKRHERQREVWRDGQLVEFTSTVDDDGDDYRVVAHRRDGALEVNGSVRPYRAPDGAMPATYWNQRIVDAPSIIHVKLGRLQDVQTSFVGEETLKINGSDIPVTRYATTGDENLDLWYDHTGTAARVIYKVGDGSEIEFMAVDEPESAIALD